MATVKVVELLAESENGWEDAAKQVLEEAGKTIQNIKSIYVKEFSAVVENQKIVRYRLNAKVSFEIMKT